MSWSIVRPSRRRHPFGAPRHRNSRVVGGSRQEIGRKCQKVVVSGPFSVRGSQNLQSFGKMQLLEFAKGQLRGLARRKARKSRRREGPETTFLWHISSISLHGVREWRGIACIRRSAWLAGSAEGSPTGAWMPCRARLRSAMGARAMLCVGSFSPSTKPSPWGAQCDTLYP